MIRINEKSITDYNLLLSSEFAEQHATSDIEFNAVPGVDGDIAISNNRFKSILQDYPLYLDMAKHEELPVINNVSNWLNNLSGWNKLIYDFDSDYFRLGYNQSEFDIESTLIEYSKVMLTFNLKPYKWLISGQNTLLITTTTSLVNPEPCPSLPLIKLFGTGTCGIVINNISYTVTGLNTGWIAIDCESGQVYTTNGNASSQINFYPFPKFVSGRNTIALRANTTKVEIVPRWRRLI